MELSCIKQEQGFEIFENEQFGQIRVVMRDGEPWFVAADVCAFFGVTNRNRVMQQVDEQDKGGTQMTTPGGMQTVTIINESGLYSLLFALQPQKGRGCDEKVLAQKLERVQNFRRWVTHEVIPSIRKHGAYLTDAAKEALFSDPDTFARVVASWNDERHARLAAEQAQAEAEAKNRLMQPKADYYDKIVDHDVNLSLSQFVKECGIGRKKFIDYLLDNKYLFRNKRGTLTPYKQYTGTLFVVKEYVADNGYGGIQTLITPEGRNYFLNKINIKAVLGC